MKGIRTTLQYVCRDMKVHTYFQENSNDYLTNGNDLLFLSSQYYKLEDKHVLKSGPFYKCAISLIYQNILYPDRLFTFVLIFHVKISPHQTEGIHNTRAKLLRRKVLFAAESL